MLSENNFEIGKFLSNQLEPLLGKRGFLKLLAQMKAFPIKIADYSCNCGIEINPVSRHDNSLCFRFLLQDLSSISKLLLSNTIDDKLETILSFIKNKMLRRNEENDEYWLEIDTKHYKTRLPSVLWIDNCVNRDCSGIADDLYHIYSKVEENDLNQLRDSLNRISKNIKTCLIPLPPKQFLQVGTMLCRQPRINARMMMYFKSYVDIQKYVDSLGELIDISKFPNFEILNNFNFLKGMNFALNITNKTIKFSGIELARTGVNDFQIIKKLEELKICDFHRKTGFLVSLSPRFFGDNSCIYHSLPPFRLFFHHVKLVYYENRWVAKYYFFIIKNKISE